MKTLSNASSIRGAQMGRPNSLPNNPNACIKLNMQKLQWIDYDYDRGGAYWGGGSGDNIYWAYGEESNTGYNFNEVEIFVRAKSRNEAKEKVRELVPNAKFFN